ncbi:DUF3395 domain-containing protein [Pelomonas cellulosilytica]|uniref:DUF3395 domain-containing protein n=1 Tax=Pelomonas cellulosilytica TaxID=2906762 RepID=A0ABS8XKY0_9BURK|nr:DUF3395 domain-containing protein [Pelomonas sp. P8]MCE4553479.1 DUF3395 domain-containing protein [Pelomonas sp. P8]
MQRRPLLLALGGSLIASLAATARADDDGDFVILHARYGTERNHVDVTGRLRELARRDRRFKLENELFGVDPDPGRTKTLRIFARDRAGHERTFEYREYEWIDGAQFIGWGGGNWGDGGSRGWHGGDDRRDDGRDGGDFTILYATYGTGRREVDVTDRLRDLARRDVRFRLGNDTFGGLDPDPGQTKTLRIVARDRAGQQRSFDYREYSIVDGNQFIGWGRGDWGRGDHGPQRPGGRLVIESAVYGNRGRNVDVTQALRAAMRGGRLEAEVSNNLVGVDPSPGQRKTLTVVYRWEGGPTNTVRVDENDWIRLP